MAATNLEKPAAPTDKRVLGTYWMLADLEEIKAAIRYMQFEVDTQEARNGVHSALQALSEQRLAEVRAEIDAIDSVFDVEKVGL